MEKQKMSITENIEISKIVWGALALLMVAYFYKKGSSGGKEMILKEALPIEFHGRVDSIYRDTRNHNAEMLILSSGYVYGVYADWEDKIKLNDSLSKIKGSLVVKVIKTNGEVIILDYNKLVKDLKL